jgi:hypothetical protein
MKNLVETVGVLILLTGVAAVIRNFVDWFSIMGFYDRIPVLGDHLVAGGIVLAVVGFALMALPEQLAKRR